MRIVLRGGPHDGEEHTISDEMWLGRQPFRVARPIEAESLRVVTEGCPCLALHVSVYVPVVYRKGGQEWTVWTYENEDLLPLMT